MQVSEEDDWSSVRQAVGSRASSASERLRMVITDSDTLQKQIRQHLFVSQVTCLSVYLEMMTAHAPACPVTILQGRFHLHAIAALQICIGLDWMFKYDILY
jgi:hypothetical protein